MSEIKTIALADVVFRDDLYPRIKPDTTTIQRYAEDITVLPPIELNQHMELIDGYHRWTAHRKVEAETINATITRTTNEAEFLKLAIERNSAHGLQLSSADKKREAVRMYAAGTGESKEEISRVLSVSVKTVTRYLSDVDKQLREERNRIIREMWLACYTQDEIAEATDTPRRTVADQINSFGETGQLSKSARTLAQFGDEDYTPPLYNVWTFARKTNAVSHFGNSEQQIVDNLLYLYTEPFDIVVDPFAGGGATIDVCKRRMRRYYVSDRKPVVERENEIRLLDLTDDLPPLDNRWSDVSLTYLDPPYWRQAEGQYSDDPTDLANMPLEAFTETLIGIVNGIAEKQSRGVVALLIQPTQWKSDDKQFTDHVMHLVNGINTERLTLENRVSCPYSTEQYNAQQVNYAKESRKLLVITRELIIWRINDA